MQKLHGNWMVAIVGWLVLGLVACGAPSGGGGGGGGDDATLLEQGGTVDENGKPTLGGTDWSGGRGKGDAVRGRRGLPVSIDESDTSVWEVENRWHETDTAAARKAGIAWSANSGLTWQEKYRKWVASLQKTDAESYGDTFMLETPYGNEIPAPTLECAEAAIFLKVAFSAWYNLPYFMEAVDRNGNRLYFGHFGIRTADGRWKNMPEFAVNYEDYSDLADQIRAGEREWPHDPRLEELGIPGAQDDEQPMIGPDARAGAYFDDVFLNKRVGYYLRLQLTYFGSINLADAVNTFNVEATSIQPGDFLVERWQQRGIGHTLIVMRRQRLGTQELDGDSFPELEAELASGSMPRRQPKWEGPAASKRALTLAKAGGPGYVEYGGGLKRWRVAREIGGRWTNVVPEGSRDAYVDSTHYERLERRPGRFEDLLVELSPEAKLESLAEVVESKRQHLRRNPSSCAARIAREDAFEDMYEVGRELGMSTAEIDQKYRKLEDYVFAELVYDKSKTCCWLSSTPEMYEIIMQYNINRITDPDADQCRGVKVFKNRNDGAGGYDLFRDFARSLGRGDDWVEWSAGESCPQRDVPADTEAEHDWTPACQIQGSFEVTDM